MNNKSEKEIINKTIIGIGACAPYPYPYKGSIILHLSTIEQRIIQKILLEEIQQDEEEYKLNSTSSDAFNVLFALRNPRIISVELRALKRIRALFTNNNPTIAADDFRFLILKINSRILKKENVNLCVQNVFAEGVKTYFNLEEANEQEIKDWISDSLVYFVR